MSGASPTARRPSQIRSLRPRSSAHRARHKGIQRGLERKDKTRNSIRITVAFKLFCAATSPRASARPRSSRRARRPRARRPRRPSGWPACATRSRPRPTPKPTCPSGVVLKRGARPRRGRRPPPGGVGPGGPRGLRHAHGRDDVLAPAGAAGALRRGAAAARLRLLCRGATYYYYAASRGCVSSFPPPPPPV